MNIEKLFTTYWSQTTLILLAIAYLVKRVFDLKSKKLEINHTIFQQNRILAVSKFLAAYSKMELLWKHLPVYQILQNEISSTDIDKIIGPPSNEFQKSILELKIYFDENSLNLFIKLSENLFTVDATLRKLYFHPEFGSTIVDNANIFHISKEKAFKGNEIIFKALTQDIRKIFKS